RYASQNGKQITDFDSAAWDWILSYHWPGNVRELKNAVERSVIMARGDTITVTDVMPRHLRVAGEVPTSVTIPVGSSVNDARRQLSLRTFASTGGDMTRTAKLLGTSPEEVRRDVMGLLSDDGAAGGAGEAASNGKHSVAEFVPTARATAPAKKPLPKKR